MKNLNKEKLIEENDAINKSHAIATFIIFAIIIWIATGFFIKEQKQEEKELISQKIFKVRVEIPKKSIQSKKYSFFGDTESSKTIILQAELNGKIKKIVKKEGSRVKKGQLIISLDVRELYNSKKQLEANFEEKKLIYFSTRKLYKQKLASKATYNKDRSTYRKAASELKAIRVKITNTKISAPFAGRVEEIFVENGEAISAYQTEIAKFINDDMLTVSVFIPEKIIDRISKPQKIKVKFANQIEKNGILKYTANSADKITRTYKAEISVDNKDHSVKDGMSAEVKFFEKEESVYLIEESSLTLNDQGVVGIKYVESDNIVNFLPVENINIIEGKIWLKSLPQNIKVITIGQAFVKTGDKVETN